MSEYAMEGAELKALLRKAGQSGKPLNYAFGLAGRPEECVLLLHRTVPAKKLMASLRDNAALRKVGFGTVRVADKTVTFVEERPVGPIGMMMPKVFKKNEIKLEVAVSDGKDGGRGAGEDPLRPKGTLSEKEEGELLRELARIRKALGG